MAADDADSIRRSILAAIEADYVARGPFEIPEEVTRRWRFDAAVFVFEWYDSRRLLDRLLFEECRACPPHLAARVRGAYDERHRSRIRNCQKDLKARMVDRDILDTLRDVLTSDPSTWRCRGHWAEAARRLEERWNNDMGRRLLLPALQPRDGRLFTAETVRNRYRRLTGH